MSLWSQDWAPRGILWASLHGRRRGLRPDRHRGTRESREDIFILLSSVGKVLVVVFWDGGGSGSRLAETAIRDNILIAADTGGGPENSRGVVLVFVVNGLSQLVSQRSFFQLGLVWEAWRWD